MSWETGTATDVADLMAKLNTFLLKAHALEPTYSGVGTGTIDNLIGTASNVLETITVTFSSSTAFSVSGSVSGALGSGTVGTPFTSTVVNFTIVAGGTAWANGDTITFVMTPPWVSQRATAGSEYIWKAPGNDAASSIYSGILRFTDAGADYDNWRLGGFTGFDSGQVFASQPGAITRPVVPLLRVGSMPYWFVANGRRAVGVVKISTNYEFFYLGFINQYANPNQFPYPLCIAGSMSWTSEPVSTSQNWRWSYTGGEHRAFSIGDTGIQTDYNRYAIRLRKPDGVWLGFGSFRASSSAVGYLWPYGYNWTNPISNLDGGYSLLPIVLHSDDGAPGIYPNITVNNPQQWGELDGVYAVTGHANAAENTITIGRTKHLVVHNINRTTKSDYYAVKLA